MVREGSVYRRARSGKKGRGVGRGVRKRREKKKGEQ